jgi:hypothetical protein
MGTKIGPGTVYPFGATEFPPNFSGVRVPFLCSVDAHELRRFHIQRKTGISPSKVTIETIIGGLTLKKNKFPF